jgi:hypothetical protein
MGVGAGAAVAGSVGAAEARATGAAVGLGDGGACRPESAVQAATRSEAAVKRDGHARVRAPGGPIPQQLNSPPTRPAIADRTARARVRATILASDRSPVPGAYETRRMATCCMPSCSPAATGRARAEQEEAVPEPTPA